MTTTAPIEGPLLDAHLVADRGAFHLDVHLHIKPGEVVALLGPNGAGKTTALRTLAGLQPLSAGHITLASVDLDHPDHRRWTPPERRPIGVVFQDYLLFPHLSTVDNVAFGPRRRGADRRTARARAHTWLTRVGVTPAANPGSSPAGRPNASPSPSTQPCCRSTNPSPPSTPAHASTTRAELHRPLGDHPGATLLVTHDPLDALVLADRLVIIEHGRVVQQGAATITAQPRTDYVARLVGLNLHRGHGDGHIVRVGDLTLTAADRVDADAFVAFPPSAVALHPTRPDGSPRNTWHAPPQPIPEVANLLNEDSTPALPEPTATGTAPTRKSDSDHNQAAGRPSASPLDGPAAPVGEGQSPQRPR